MTKSNVEKVEKVLGEPVAPEFSDYVRKLRSTLFAVSVIGISMVLGNLELASNSTFLGLRFKGLSDTNIINGLFIINAYLLFHFIWCSFDTILAWWVRITGTRLAFVTTGKSASGYADYPSDPNQSSLYYWWKDEAKKIGSFIEPMQQIESKLSKWQSEVFIKLENRNDPNITIACQQIRHVSTDIGKLMCAVEQSAKTIVSARIPVSLGRFDKRYSLFLRSQNLRWLLLELGLPILLGMYSLCLLVQKF